MNHFKSVLTIAFLLFVLQNSAQTTYATITKSTSLRSENTSESKVLKRLTENDKIIYLDDCGVYYCKVEFNGQIGWVKKHLIDINTNLTNDHNTSSEQLENLETGENLQQDTSFSTEAFAKNKPSNNSAFSLDFIILICFILICGLLYLSYFLLRKNKDSQNSIEQLKQQYQGILNVEDEIQKRRSVIELEEDKSKKLLEKRQKLELELKSKYRDAKKTYDKLIHESNLLKADLDITEFGVYEPQFDYDTSAIYKLKIKENRDKQKDLIRGDQAVLGGEGWTVNGSISSGKAMIKKQKKLMLRAFNGECGNFIKGVKWNNEQIMEERILKSADIISRLNEKQNLNISSEFIQLKLLELRLTHEYELKKYEEKEIQREIRERIREEERAIKEFEKAKREAEKEEKLIQSAMKKAQELMEKASSEERAIYEGRLQSLTEKLKIAEEKNQRAISMAQQTKAGHVYVISNIGSFGENIYKIGMTRRLEPMDRIYELGDASVPFRFDVHAMIYSENAPELESKLHAKFDKYRLNHVNRRREYFNVSLSEIEKVVKENHGEIEFIIEPEAKEYRESLVIKERILQQYKVPEKKKDIFSVEVPPII